MMLWLLIPAVYVIGALVTLVGLAAIFKINGDEEKIWHWVLALEWPIFVPLTILWLVRQISRNMRTVKQIEEATDRLDDYQRDMAEWVDRFDSNKRG